MFSMLFIMMNVNFIVFLFCIFSCACYSKYCKISINHVLCKYPMPGPSISCKGYDKNSFLTDDDINDLVNQINGRRNFIAMGNSIRLPGAANMKKIIWSEELAIFAQRWVDQCDPSIRPDKEDQCRDLEHKKVGQNIASILNPSRGFNVKSFIEMWFMKILEYTGSVTYYDQLQDYNSKQFIQLIWAETESVGCGKAKFNVNKIAIERIVCNFSPKGNIHGEPAYTIGLPGSQCRNEMVPDENLKGLCTQKPPLQGRSSSADSTVSSLLRVINLSNDSVKQEIDPIYINIKQINPSTYEMESPRYQKMRHVIRNKVLSRTQSPQEANFWESPTNKTRNYKDYFHDREKGHSRISHSHNFKYTNQPWKTNQEDYRKHAFRIPPSTPYSEDPNGNDNYNKKCTRSTACLFKDCGYSSTRPYNKIAYECTRGKRHKCKLTVQESETATMTNDVEHIVSHELCACETHSTTCLTSNTQDRYKLNCQCIDDNGLTVRCPNLFRRVDDSIDNQKSVSERYDNYDGKLLHKDTYSVPEYEHDWLINQSRKKKPYTLKSSYIQTNSKRKKREFKDVSTFKPFWQLDSFNNGRNPQLKSLRYTTLVNRRRLSKKYPSKPAITESITINFQNSKFKFVTEKYLSFDELLHLRKLNQSSYNARRKIEPPIVRNATEEKETTIQLIDKAIGRRVMNETTSEYTTNTPFIRIKQCTRKLTCTWTAASITDSNGSVIGGGGHGYQGSKTPPGYVEGCTRTSTCTRDFMERNKFPTETTDATNNDESDSDYCERRSLSIKKRNSYRFRRYLVPGYQKEYYNIKKGNTGRNNDDNISKISLIKKTRSNINSVVQSSYKYGNPKNKCPNSNIFYGDLSHRFLGKIMEKLENYRKNIPNKQSPCSKANSRQLLGNILMLLIFYTSLF